ncbi:MAG: hypothetical protein GX053_02895 [Tissierella sp.]|nr:hypothetical protein [Tissierella sp.]
MKPITLKNHNTEILSLYLSKELNILTIALKDSYDLVYDNNSKEESSKLFENREIDMVTLKKSISMLRDNSGESSLLSIGFYSKDPVLELGLIRKIVDYCNEQLINYKIGYLIDTNLGLLTDEVLEFLERENFQLLTDMDVSYTNSIRSLENKAIRNILKIKREYKGLFNNIKTVSSLIEDCNGNDNYNNFLNNIKKIYSENNKNHTAFYNKKNKEFLNCHRNTYSVRNKGSMIDPYIWQIQGLMGNTEGVWRDMGT